LRLTVSASLLDAIYSTLADEVIAPTTAVPA
jgi:hypothetical protein